MKKTRLDDLHEKRFIRMNKQGTGSILIVGLSPTNDIMLQGAKQIPGTENFDYKNTKVYFSLNELEAGEIADYIKSYKLAFNLNFQRPQQYPEISLVHKTDTVTKTLKIKGNVYMNKRTNVEEFQLGVSIHDSSKQQNISIYLSKAEMSVFERILDGAVETSLGSSNLMPSKVIVCTKDKDFGTLTPTGVEIETSIPKMNKGDYIQIKGESRQINQVHYNIIKGYPIYFVV